MHSLSIIAHHKMGEFAKFLGEQYSHIWIIHSKRRYVISAREDGKIKITAEQGNLVVTHQSNNSITISMEPLENDGSGLVLIPGSGAKVAVEYPTRRGEEEGHWIGY